jgi:AcrR family transcriptional regulator
MTRTYRKAKRGESQEETREKILRATIEMHLERGVATTSYSDVAERAGVGAATVYRHFPTMGSLIEACGAHIWQAIEPPRPEHVSAKGWTALAAFMRECLKVLGTEIRHEAPVRAGKAA